MSDSDQLDAPDTPDEPVKRIASRAQSISPSERAQSEERSHRMLLLAVRLIYMVLLVTVTLLPFVGTVTDQEEFSFADYAGAFIATFVFGAAVLLLDAITPNKRLASFFGIYLGIVAGLAGAVAVGALLDLIAESWDLTTKPWVAYLGLVKLAIGITLCYLAVSLVLTTKDDFRLVIPYVEFAKQVRGVRPLLLDTSVIIDGRLEPLGPTGFLDAPLVVPQFVVDELQTLADSSDRLKRERGRHSLDIVRELQNSPYLDVTIDPARSSGHSVDHLLLQMAAERSLRILTTDFNLNKVAQIQGVPVLNLNDLANTLRPSLVAGDTLEVEIIKRGETPTQGVGYLPEGTMVVVENAADRIGTEIPVVVTNSLRTSAGRMIFARPADEDGEPAANMARAATQQARATARPQRTQDDSSRRNPRR